MKGARDLSRGEKCSSYTKERCCCALWSGSQEGRISWACLAYCGTLLRKQQKYWTSGSPGCSQCQVLWLSTPCWLHWQVLSFPGCAVTSVNCRTVCYLLSSVSAGHTSLAKDTILTFEKAIISIKKLLISIKGSEMILISTCFLFHWKPSSQPAWKL